MPFGDYTEEELQRMQQLYKGFLSGKLGQTPEQTAPPPAGILSGMTSPEVPQSVPQAQTPTPQPGSPSILDKIKGFFQPSPAQAQPQQPSGKPDIAGLLGQPDKEQKLKWLLPLSMGMLNMGAGMSGPYYPGMQAPPWVRGVQGLGTGIMQGIQTQTAAKKADQEALANKLKTMVELKKAYGEGERINLGGKWYIRQPNGQLLQEKEYTDKIPTKDAVDKIMDENPGMSRSDATKLNEKSKAEGKAEGTPEKLEKPDQMKIYEDPNTKDRVAVRKGEIPPAGYYEMPKAPTAGGAASGSRLLNAKAWILGTKPMTSFRGDEKAAIAEMAYNAGFDTQDMATIQSNYKSLNSSKSKLANQQALIEAFTNNAKLNMDLGNKLSEGVSRYGSPKANEWLQWFKGTIMGQEVPITEDVKAFNAIVGPTANEWAKVMTSASGAGGVVSDASRKETWDLLNTTLNKSQFKNVGQVMQSELENRGKGIRMEHQRIDNDINTMSKYVDDKFTAAYPELVKPSSVERPNLYGKPVVNTLQSNADAAKERIMKNIPSGPERNRQLQELDQIMKSKQGGTK